MCRHDRSCIVTPMLGLRVLSWNSCGDRWPSCCRRAKIPRCWMPEGSPHTLSLLRRKFVMHSGATWPERMLCSGTGLRLVSQARSRPRWKLNRLLARHACASQRACPLVLWPSNKICALLLGIMPGDGQRQPSIVLNSSTVLPCFDVQALRQASPTLAS